MRLSLQNQLGWITFDTLCPIYYTRTMLEPAVVEGDVLLRALIVGPLVVEAVRPSSKD